MTHFKTSHIHKSSQASNTCSSKFPRLSQILPNVSRAKSGINFEISFTSIGWAPPTLSPVRHGRGRHPILWIDALTWCLTVVCGKVEHVYKGDLNPSILSRTSHCMQLCCLPTPRIYVQNPSEQYHGQNTDRPSLTVASTQIINWPPHTNTWKTNLHGQFYMFPA